MLDAPGAISTFIYGRQGMNDLDQAVGTAETDKGGARGFYWSGGNFVLLPGCAYLSAIANAGFAAGLQTNQPSTFAAGDCTAQEPGGRVSQHRFGIDGTELRIVGVDDAGQTLVSFKGDHGLMHGALLSGDSVTRVLTLDADPGHPASTQTVPMAISNNGLVVGTYSYGRRRRMRTYGFSFRHDTYTTIGFPGAIATIPQAVLDNGTVAGNYVIADGYQRFVRGFIESKGVFTTIPPPQRGLNVSVTGLSQTGEVVVNGAVLYRHGSYVPINFPADWKGSIVIISGITARGTLYGFLQDQHNKQHGFLATCPAGETCQ